MGRRARRRRGYHFVRPKLNMFWKYDPLMYLLLEDTVCSSEWDRIASLKRRSLMFSILHQPPAHLALCSAQNDGFRFRGARALS